MFFLSSSTVYNIVVLLHLYKASAGAVNSSKPGNSAPTDNGEVWVNGEISRW